MKKYFTKLAYGLISKKFQVFVVATLLLWFGKLDSMSWSVCAISYISLEVAQKIFKKEII